MKTVRSLAHRPPLVLLPALVLLLASAAASAQMAPEPPAPPPAEADAGTAAEAETPPPADPSLLPMRNAMEYVCGDGHLVLLERDEPAGLIRAVRGGETFTLFEQVGRTPARFVSGSDSVDLDGDTALLRRGRVARQTCRKLPAATESGFVWGTLTKMDRMALPAGTRAKVLLVDGARMDAPAIELASTNLRTTGNQVPLHYLILYDPARVQGPARPLLQARIEDSKGRLMYITTMANPLPADGARAEPVELKLVRTDSE